MASFGLNVFAQRKQIIKLVRKKVTYVFIHGSLQVFLHAMQNSLHQIRNLYTFIFFFHAKLTPKITSKETPKNKKN